MNLRTAGFLVAFGFLAASAFANFIFAYTLGKTALLSVVYGSVGVLATASNALTPLFMLRAWDARRYSVLAAGAALLPFCVAFSLVSAMGFAASVRDKATAEQAALSGNYKTTLTQLNELEAKPRTLKIEQRIEALRQEIKAYRDRGAMRADDPQAATLAVFGISDGRYFVSVLFALLVEIGSTLGLFISLAGSKPHSELPVPEAPRWRKTA